MGHLHNTKARLAHSNIFFRISKCPCAPRKVPSYARVNTGFRIFLGDTTRDSHNQIIASY